MIISFDGLSFVITIFWELNNKEIFYFRYVIKLFLSLIFTGLEFPAFLDTRQVDQQPWRASISSSRTAWTMTPSLSMVSTSPWRIWRGWSWAGKSWGTLMMIYKSSMPSPRKVRELYWGSPLYVEVGQSSYSDWLK